MEMELVWKGSLTLLVVLFVFDWFVTAWRVKRIARDMRRVVTLLDQLLQFQRSQQLAQRGAARGVGDVQLGPR